MSKRTGTTYERKLKEKLFKLPTIITAIRSAGSKGSGDITAILNNLVIIFEVKSTWGQVYYLSKDKEQSAMLKELAKLKANYPLKIYFAVWFMNKHWEFYEVNDKLTACKLGKGKELNTIIA